MTTAKHNPAHNTRNPNRPPEYTATAKGVSTASCGSSTSDVTVEAVPEHLTGPCIAATLIGGGCRTSHAVTNAHGAGLMTCATHLAVTKRVVAELIDGNDSIHLQELFAAHSSPAPAVPQWRTLKGVAVPFLVHVKEASGQIWTARDRKAPDGEPVRIVRLEMDGGLRRGYTEDGKRVDFSGVATKVWVTQ